MTELRGIDGQTYVAQALTVTGVMEEQNTPVPDWHSDPGGLDGATVERQVDTFDDIT